MSRKIPEKWQSSVKAAKATQVAFDMDEKIQLSIRKQALEAGISPSEQIRDILGLPTNKRPKRPRLTVSLSADDYQLLAEKYDLQAEQQLEIKKKLMDDLINARIAILDALKFDKNAKKINFFHKQFPEYSNSDWLKTILAHYKNAS